MHFPSFIGPSNVAQSSIADAERTVNYYVERTALPGEKNKAVLYPTPGVTTITTATQSPGRGSFEAGGRAFVVIGNTFSEITEPLALISWGTVAVNDNPVTMSYNGDGGQEVFITSGENGYIFNLGSNLLTLVRTGNTTMGAFIDGFFLALDVANSALYISDFLDGTTWDATQFQQRNAAGDKWVSLIVNYHDIWLVGEKTSDVWYNAGLSPFPLLPRPGGTVPYGTSAPWSVEVAGDAVHWLAQSQNGDGQVVRVSGYTPQVISTPALQVALASYSDTTDAVGDTFEMLGHTFYFVSFPTARATWLFDMQSGVWTELGTWISAENSYAAWRPLYHVFAYGRHLMLDRETGAIYELSSTAGLDADGRPLRRLRRAPALFTENRRVFISRFELMVEPGLGAVSGQGSDPQIQMRISPDGGKTFGNERSRSAGALGKYRHRTFWTRCGSARDPVIETTMSDPIPYRLIDAYITLARSAEA